MYSKGRKENISVIHNRRSVLLRKAQAGIVPCVHDCVGGGEGVGVCARDRRATVAAHRASSSSSECSTSPTLSGSPPSSSCASGPMPSACSALCSCARSSPVFVNAPLFVMNSARAAIPFSVPRMVGRSMCSLTSRRMCWALSYQGQSWRMCCLVWKGDPCGHSLGSVGTCIW